MSDNQTVIDFPEALARTLGDVEFLQSMLFEFKKIAPDFVERIQAALKAGDMDSLTKDAHQFKGSAANLGIKTVAAVALELEKIGKNHQAEKGLQALDRLKTAIDDFFAVLNQTDFSTLSED